VRLLAVVACLAVWHSGSLRPVSAGPDGGDDVAQQCVVTEGLTSARAAEIVLAWDNLSPSFASGTIPVTLSSGTMQLRGFLVSGGRTVFRFERRADASAEVPTNASLRIQEMFEWLPLHGVLHPYEQTPAVTRDGEELTIRLPIADHGVVRVHPVTREGWEASMGEAIGSVAFSVAAVLGDAFTPGMASSATWSRSGASWVEVPCRLSTSGGMAPVSREVPRVSLHAADVSVSQLRRVLYNLGRAQTWRLLDVEVARTDTSDPQGGAKGHATYQLSASLVYLPLAED
jgi:hypothetical protein